MHSHACSEFKIKKEESVLILVVMEDALAPTMSTKKLTALLVLILVVMEDALALREILLLKLTQ